MIRFFRRALVAVTLFSISGVYAASNNSVDLLTYIPADTPYVFVSTEPLPASLANKLEPTVDEILKTYQRILRHVIAEQTAKISSEDGGAEKAEKFRGVADEVLSLMSLEGFRGAGIDRESAFALYGNGLLPVLRLELTSADLFDAAIERIEAKAGKALSSGEVNGKSYRYVDAEKVKLVIATLDDQAIITVVPTVFDDQQLESALGLKKPRKNLKRSKTLRAIQKEYGFSDYLLGYIDNHRIAEIFTGKGSRQDNELFTALGHTPASLTETCATEIMDTVGIAPRVVFGYSELSTDYLVSALVVELREDIAEGLMSIPAAVPGLGKDTGGLMSFGLGLNPLALREFYESRLDAMEADPYECEKFAKLQAGVAKGRDALNQPIPPVVYGFRGFVANVADIKGMDMASKTPPQSVDASILIAVENAESLVMMAAMFDPQIAALNLLPDGMPVKLEMPHLAAFASEAFAALSNDALSISVGSGSETKSADMLVADSADPAPFLSMNMDVARYYSMIGEAMASESESDEENQMPEAMRSAVRDVMMLSGSMYERMSVDVRFTERGIEIGGRMKLSD